MIVCPACHAENPDGTKICVKCATELPKPAGAAKTKAAASEKKFGMRDIGRDMVDLLWLLLIIFIICLGFWHTATNGTMHLTDTEEAKIMNVPIVVARPPVHHVKKHGHAPVVVAENETQPPEVISEEPKVPSGSAETFFQKGKEQYDGKHYQTSFNYLRQALEIDPTYAKAYFGLGYLYARFDMDDAAVRMYEMALRFDPNHVESINNLAMMYFRAGNYDDSIVLFQKAVALDGQNEDYQYNLGRVYLEKDQFNEALQAYQTASLLKAGDDRVYNDMALIYEKVGKKQEAQDSWQKVMQYSTNPTLLQQAKAHLDFLQTQS